MKALFTPLAYAAVIVAASSASAQSYYMLEEFGSNPQFSYTNAYSYASFTANGGTVRRIGTTTTFTNETDQTLTDVRFYITGILAAYQMSDSSFQTTTFDWDPDSNRFVGDNPALTSPYDGDATDHTAWLNLGDGSSLPTVGVPLSETGIPDSLYWNEDSFDGGPAAPVSWGLDAGDYHTTTLDMDLVYPHFVIGDVAAGETVNHPFHYLRIEQPQGTTGAYYLYVHGRWIASAVPEPSTAVLSGLAGCAALLLRRRGR